MANSSDAFGTIKVQKVGQEFLDFLIAVQGEKSEAYYTLVDRDDLAQALHAVDEDGNLTFDFSTSGRWEFTANIEGYLDGKWLLGTEHKDAYLKFIEAVKEKNGLVEVEYTDSDSSNDWMGTGLARLEVVDGEVRFDDDFNTREFTIAGYAELNGEDPYWALEMIHGDDAAKAFDSYIEKCKKGGVEPVEVDEWYDTVYEEV